MRKRTGGRQEVEGEARLPLPWGIADKTPSGLRDWLQGSWGCRGEWSSVLGVHVRPGPGQSRGVRTPHLPHPGLLQGALSPLASSPRSGGGGSRLYIYPGVGSREAPLRRRSGGEAGQRCGSECPAAGSAERGLASARRPACEKKRIIPTRPTGGAEIQISRARDPAGFAADPPQAGTQK